MKLIKSNHIVTDVVLEAPTGDTCTIKGVRFKYMSEDELVDFAKTHGDSSGLMAIEGWESFIDADGVDLPFCEAVIDELKTIRWAVLDVLTKYTESVMGLKAKNFHTSALLGALIKAKTASEKQSTPLKRKTTSKGSVSRKKKAKRS